jgi:ribosome-dependent ATPase
MVTFSLLVLMAIFVFNVPVKGSFATLALGTLLYVFSTTGFGQLVSTFTRTQVAAVFATSILAVIPVVNFSGLIVPVSSPSGEGRFLGLTFPAAWYQPISVGAFTKALGLSDLWFNLIILAAFALFYLVAGLIVLQKQEA